MNTLELFRRLGPLDARAVGRDTLLRGMLLLPLAVALPIRFLLPLIIAQIGLLVGVDTAGLYAPIAGASLLLITPTIYGTVIGFLLLDQRDERTLAALRVTPLSLDLYLAYRLIIPVLLSIVMTLVSFALAGIADFGVAAIVVGTVSAAPLTALAALALVAFAENKVQGMALMKAGSMLLILANGGIFAPAPWRWIFLVLPTTWPAHLLVSQQSGTSSYGLLLVGLVYHTILLLMLRRRMLRGLP